MTVQEIKNYALLLSGLRDIPDAYVFIYINQTMDELLKYDEVGKKRTATIVALENMWSDLPVGCVSVKRVKDNNKNVKDFIIENGQILFETEGTYTIEYIGQQDRVSALANTPEVNILFHDVLAYGVALKETNRIFMHENNNNKIILLNEYNERALAAVTKLRLMKKSRQRIKYAPMI